MASDSRVTTAKRALEQAGVSFGEVVDKRPAVVPRVFRSEHNNVVKITFEFTEAQVALWQLNERAKGLPKIIRVTGVLIDQDPDEVAYAILREDVQDAGIVNETDFNLAITFSGNPNHEKKLSDEDRRMLLEAVQLQNDLKAHLSVGDFTADNLGRTSNGHLVLRDFGSCRVNNGS